MDIEIDALRLAQLGLQHARQTEEDREKEREGEERRGEDDRRRKRKDREDEREGEEKEGEKKRAKKRRAAREDDGDGDDDDDDDERREEEDADEDDDEDADEEARGRRRARKRERARCAAIILAAAPETFALAAHLAFNTGISAKAALRTLAAAAPAQGAEAKRAVRTPLDARMAATPVPALGSEAPGAPSDADRILAAAAKAGAGRR